MASHELSWFTLNLGAPGKVKAISSFLRWGGGGGGLCSRTFLVLGGNGEEQLLARCHMHSANCRAGGVGCVCVVVRSFLAPSKPVCLSSQDSEGRCR